MILKKYRILILILICITLINFTFEYKAYAEPITITAGLYAFLQAAYAAGLTYIAGTAVVELTEDSIELYKEWQKFNNNKPPEERPPTDWEKTSILTMLGLKLGDSFKRLVDSVKDFFSELGAKEGDNTLQPNSYYFDSESDEIITSYLKLSKNSKFIFSIQGQTIVFYVDTRVISGKYNYYLRAKTNKEDKDVSGGFQLWQEGMSIPEIRFNHVQKKATYFNYNYDRTGSGTKHYNTVSYEPTSLPIIEDTQVINYYFENNTYQFTNNPEDIRPVYPNLSVLPAEKLTEENGKLIYQGTQDDLVDDLVKNADPDNLFKTNPNPRPIEELEPGKIVVGDAVGTNPNPDPNPDPKPGEGTDPKTDVDGILDKVFDPDTKEKLNTDKLRKERNFTTRFPFSIPWDLARVVRLFARPPSPPDLGVNINNDYLNINYTLDLNSISLPIRFFRYAVTAFFVFFLASKTRDVIKW